MSPQQSWVLAWRRVRILLDYRPALRARTGVGEYAHEMAAALVAPARRRATAWPSSRAPGRTGCRRARCPACRSSTRASRCAFLNLAWHRLGWPPVETLRRRRRHRPLDASAPDAGAARRAGRHHPRPVLPRSPRRTPPREIRRDYPALAAIARPARRRGRHRLRLHRGQVRARLGVPAIASRSARPARPPGRRVAPPRAGRPDPLHGHARAAQERRRRCFAPTPTCSRAGPMRRRSSWRAGSRQRVSRWLDAIDAPPLAGTCAHLGYVSGPERERLYRAGVDARPALARRRLRACRRSKR